ncbi:DNA cytosine methyltransferase [Brevibacillus laterosporus]|uniref:DNA cytosine methyltransferase n=1 Tax=Brevibacillus laterosporus TaxID=1465 RepID=UPI0018F8A648|nr:DNA cytosine methyltransferase [Brevibacillus laterosporus]MBG9776168.1 DNA methyltransferase [Brevibacillus laterosporus]
MIKERKAKNSSRGIYLQDKELKQTSFQPSSHFKYIVDPVNKKVIIVPSDNEKDNTVSKRVMSDGVKPVIDIRKQEALAVFKECDYLQVQIYEEQIIVEGYQQAEESIVTKVGNKIKKAFGRKSKVTDITNILPVKKKVTVAVSREELKKVVGSTFDISEESFDFVCQNENINEGFFNKVKESLKNLAIPLQITSLFSGAGIMDLGFKQAGFDIVFALEKDPDAVKTYRYNHGGYVVHADITKFDKTSITKAPIMIGGSPCKGFSNSNRNTNFLDNPNNLLVREYIEAIKRNENCKVFVLENVPQILTAGNGQFKNEIYEQLSDFEITSGKMKAVSFGVPQDRERAIIIGSKIGRIELPEPTFRPEYYKTVRDAFGGLNDSIPNQLDVSKAKELTIKRMSYVPQGGNVFNIPEEIRPKGKHSDLYKRLEWDKPSITIVNPRKATITHPEENRIISVREAARLQSIPDDFIFQGTLNGKQQQVADGVPFNLAYAVAKVIKKAIMKFNFNNWNIHSNILQS